MICRPVWLLWLILSVVAAPASAHPGHGTPGGDSSASHYLTEPVHALFLFVATGLVIAAAGWITRKAGAKRGRGPSFASRR